MSSKIFLNISPLIILAYLLVPHTSYSQNSSDFIQNRKSEINFLNSSNNYTIEETLELQTIKKDNFGLQLIEKKRNNKVLILAQTHNDIEIYSAGIKTTYNNKGKSIINSSSTLQHFVAENKSMPNLDELILSGNLTCDKINSFKQYYFPLSENIISPAIKVNYNIDGINYFSFFDSDYKELYKSEISLHKKLGEIKKANASVFLPDPITSSNNEYGGDYAHNNGSTNSSLEAEQFDVEIDCLFENGIYYLENEHIKIEDMFSPYWTVVNSNDGNFIYNRSQKGFQQVNAFYHLTEIKKQIITYGFTDAVNYLLRVDADGAKGDDNSFFHPHNADSGEAESASLMEFGAYDSTSGIVHVPDAEDAEVLVHEFTHAIINSYSNERITTERKCLEEALSDYIAVSYASDINDNNWEKVFKWDGHNEFWSGRSAVSTKCYTDLSFTNIRDNIDVWLAPLMELYFQLGRSTTDKLVLNTITALDPYTTMEDAALIMMKMDTVYNANINSQAIYTAFNKYCILNESHLSIENNKLRKFKVLNSDQFSKGSFLTIEFEDNFNGNIKIYNIQGQQISQQNYSNKKYIKVDSKNLNNGIYLIKITEGSFHKVIKVCKL